ncbi:MAG: ACT domain-containing protein [Chloroflexota bacterium]
MRKYLVMTVNGQDKVGLVEEVTKLVLDFNGNVEASRMARLEGEFAMLMLVSVPEPQFKTFRQSVRDLRGLGYKISTKQTERGFSRKFAGWNVFQIKVTGADNEGLIYEITHHLAEKGINVERMDTGMRPAPFGGGALFTMSAVVVVPPTISISDLREDLEEIGDKLNMDTEVSYHSE